jgi:NitT/TauT family transport system substrate-binding protein
VTSSRGTFVRRAGFAAMAAACRVLPAPAAAQGLEPLTVGVLPPSDISGEPYYAAGQGFFRKAGLDVTIQPLANGAATIAAVVSGHLDVAYSNMISLAIAHDHGIQTSILAPANLHVHAAPTAGILAVKKSSPIVSAKDLNEKIVAVEGLNNIAEIATRDWIDKNGGDSKSIKFVEITLSAMSAALIANRVDAAVMNAIYDTTIGKPDDPLRRLCSSTFDAIAPNFAPSVWFSSPQFVAAHPATALAFVRAMRETADWANEHRSDSAAILAGYTKQTVAEIQSVRRVTYGTAIDPRLIQPAIDVVAKYGLIKTSFPASEMIAKLGSRYR